MKKVFSVLIALFFLTAIYAITVVLVTGKIHWGTVFSMLVIATALFFLIGGWFVIAEFREYFGKTITVFQVVLGLDLISLGIIFSFLKLTGGQNLINGIWPWILAYVLVTNIVFYL